MSTGVINLNGSLDFDIMGGREHQITITAVVSSMNIGVHAIVLIYFL